MVYLVSPNSTTAQVQINQAISDAASGTAKVVHLKAGTYYISDTIWLRPGVTLEGEGENTIIKLADSVNRNGNDGKYYWTSKDIGVRKAMFMLYNEIGSGFKLSNFVVDGSYEDFYTSVVRGAGTFTICQFNYGNNIKIERMTFKNGINDAICLYKGEGLTVANTIIDKCGYDCMSAYDSSNVVAHDCIFTINNNSGLGIYNVNNFIMYNCDVSTDTDGLSGVKIYGGSKYIQIHHNYFHDLKQEAIKTWDGDSTIVIQIYNNIICACKGIGFTPGAEGVKYAGNIYNNIIDGNTIGISISPDCIGDYVVNVSNNMITNNDTDIIGNAIQTNNYIGSSSNYINRSYYNFFVIPSSYMYDLLYSYVLHGQVIGIDNVLNAGAGSV